MKNQKPLTRRGMISAALLCLALVAPLFSQQRVVDIHGQLTIRGNKVVDKNGRPVTLHGMSMYAWAQQGLQFYNATAIRRLVQEWRCTVIRIPILPNQVSSQTNLVKTVVDACIANGVYAIIDWHSMGGANATECANFMKSMAAAYGNTPNVMYEPWNEPVNENWATIKAYMETVIAAIRSVDPDNIIWCGTPQWDQRPDLAAANPITVSANIGYTFHFYAASHRVSSMGNNVRNACRTQALFATEYGLSEASGNGTIDVTEAQRWWRLLDSLGVGCTNWSVSALGETSAAFRSGTSSTNWTDADLKPSGVAVKAYILSTYDGTVNIPDGGSGSSLYHSPQKRLPVSPRGYLVSPVAAVSLNGVVVGVASKSFHGRGYFIIRSPESGTWIGVQLMHH